MYSEFFSACLFCIFSFYSTDMTVTCKRWNLIYDAKNYFVENNRTSSVMIWKDRVNYQELQKNTYIFFPSFVAHSHLIKLFKFVYLLTACPTFSKYNWFGKQQSILWKVSLIYKKKTAKQNEAKRFYFRYHWCMQLSVSFFLNFVNVNCKL